MHWFQGPQHWLDHHKLSRDRRHEPFTPRLPGLILAHPALAGLALVVFGILGNWMISTRMSDWPAWMLFPSMILAVVSLIMMVIGLGLLTVRMLEPVLGLIETPRRLPNSITEAVLGNDQAVVGGKAAAVPAE